MEKWWNPTSDIEVPIKGLSSGKDGGTRSPMRIEGDDVGRTDGSPVVLIEILNTLWSLSGFANFFYPGPFQQAIGGEAC